MPDKIVKKINFSSPGIYHIRVLGKVCSEIWEYFDVETEQVTEDKKEQVITSLKIHVRDQAELSGLIATIYSWHLVLLSVQVEESYEDTVP